MSFNLSEGAIEAILTGNPYDNPVFQVIDSKLIPSDNGTGRYKLLLSDGRHTYSLVMLVTKLEPMIQTGEMDNYCLIRCKRYNCKTLQGDRTMMILVEVEVLANGWYIESKIGNPQPYLPGRVPDHVPAQPAPGGRISNPQPFIRGPVPDKVPAQPAPGGRISNPQPCIRGQVPDTVPSQTAPGGRISNPKPFIRGPVMDKVPAQPERGRRIGDTQPFIRGPVPDKVPAQPARGGRINDTQSFPLDLHPTWAQPTSNISTAINTSLIVQGESPVTMNQVSRCRDFLNDVIMISTCRPDINVIIVTAIVQGLIDGKLEPEKFEVKLHEQLESSPQPYLVRFLKKVLPLLREELFNNKMEIPGIKRPPLQMVRRRPVPQHAHQVAHTSTDSQPNKHTTTCASSATSSTSSATSSTSSATSFTSSATLCMSSPMGPTNTSILAGSSVNTPRKEEKATELPMNTSIPAVSSNNIHEHLICAICLDLYTEPVRLNCMHCFCRKCITDHTVKGVNSIPSCPECNSTILTKEIGILKTDFKLKELVSAIRDKPLCSDHDAQDERIAELICMTCHVTLCTKCAFAGQHVAHVLDDLQTAVHKYHSEMSTKIPNIKEKLDGYCTQITEVRHHGTELQDLRDKTETEFNRLIEDLQDKVLKIKAEGFEEISDSFNMVKAELGKKEATLSTNIRNGEKFMKCHSSLNTDPANSIKEIANADGYLDNDPVHIEEPDRVAILDNCPSLAAHFRQLKHMVESCQQFMQPSRGGANTGKFPAKRKTDATSTTRIFQVPGKRVKLDETIGTEQLTENGAVCSTSGSGDHMESGPSSGEQSRPSGSGNHRESGPYSRELSQEGIDSSQKSPPSVVNLTASFVKVGTYSRPPIGPVVISETGLCFCIEGATGNLNFNIWPHEIQQCLIGNIIHRDISLIFLLTTHSCGVWMRKDLGMATHSDPLKSPQEPYFDPSRPEMRYNMITIVIEALSKQSRLKFLKYMELIKLRCKQGDDDGFIIELKSTEAHEMFRQSNVRDYSSVVATSKASDEDQQ